MANTILVSTQKALASYTKLREKVRSALLLGQQRVEQEKVRTYWETGRLIHAHLLQNKDRADYGKEIIAKLSHDLKVHERLLYQCSQFAREFKNLNARSNSLTGLSWAHYRKLATVSDEKKREKLVQLINKEEWTSRDLEQEIKKEKIVRQLEETEKPPELLKPVRGSLYTYRLRLDPIIQSAKPVLRVDLGFSCYQEVNTRGFKAGDIIETVPHPRGVGTGYLLRKAAKTSSDLFTFKAYVERIIDGDTLVVQVDLGFSLWTRQYLRLRGIDCPEMDTLEGKKAKRFVERELESVPYIIISSSKSDKYDRYLTDIFYPSGKEEKFLNNELLLNRLAVRM